MPWVIECTHSMVLAIESTHSTAQPLNAYINDSSKFYLLIIRLENIQSRLYIKSLQFISEFHI